MTDFFQLDADEQVQRLTQLAVNALEAWGVTDCQPRLIKYRENAVYEVQTAGGERAALRVHRQGYHDEDSLESELKWMAMLGDGGLKVPSPIPTLEGAIVFDGSADDVPGIWKVDMLAWVGGRELGTIGEPLELDGYDVETVFFNIGKTMGTLHNLSSDWPEQDSQKRHKWDKAGLVGDQPLWGEFWKLNALSDEQRELVERARKAIGEDLDAYGQTSDNYGLIHADMLSDNIMLDGNDIKLIDFDDAGFGWHMFEIITCLYWLGEEPEYDKMRNSLLEGYKSVRPLGDADLAMMDLFFAARSLSYLGWVHTRSETETAKELTPFMISNAEDLCTKYLNNRNTSDN